VFHGLYQGKRPVSGSFDVSREFSSIRVVGPYFPSWCGPNVAQGWIPLRGMACSTMTHRLGWMVGARAWSKPTRTGG